MKTSVNQIKNILEKVKPAQQPQERYLNFIPFYIKYKEAFIEELLEKLKPFDNILNILVESETDK